MRVGPLMLAGGIVIDSVAERELQEMDEKASAIKDALAAISDNLDTV